MPALDKNLVKSWFVSRAKPFASQFAQWIDACWFKGETIPIADITGLETRLTTITLSITASVPRPEEKIFLVDGTFPMLAKYRLNGIGVINSSAVDMTLNIGTTPGGSEVCNIDLPASGTAAIDIGRWFFAEATIYVTNVLGTCILLIDRK